MRDISTDFLKNMPIMIDSRIVAAKPAMQLIRQLVSQHGPLEFRISGSCVEGFVPRCVQGDGRGPREAHFPLGLVEGCPAYIQPASCVVEDNAHFVLHVEKGKTNPGSLEAPGNVRFLLSRKAARRETSVDPHMFSYLFGYSGNWG
jgi:uncharacterized protein (DUF779 family)